MNQDEMILKYVLEKLRNAEFEKGGSCPASRECEGSCEECGGLISKYELFKLLGILEVK